MSPSAVGGADLLAELDKRRRGGGREPRDELPARDRAIRSSVTDDTDSMSLSEFHGEISSGLRSSSEMSTVCMEGGGAACEECGACECRVSGLRLRCASRCDSGLRLLRLRPAPRPGLRLGRGLLDRVRL